MRHMRRLKPAETHFLEGCNAMKKITFKALVHKGKTFLIQKGERVGLAICGVIALLFMGMGIMKGMNPAKPPSGLPWEKELQIKTEVLDAALRQGERIKPKEVEVDRVA